MSSSHAKDKDSMKESRDARRAGIDAALRRAQVKAWRRAAEHSGKVAVFKDGKTVWVDASKGPPPDA